MLRFAVFAVIVSVLSACGSGTPVTLHNTSKHRLESVVISGSGFQASLGTVAAGQSLTAKVYPSGESGLAMTFTAGGKNFSYEPQDYFEGGGRYKVSATVNRNLTLAVHSDTWP
jgi:hypothetical protein